MNIESTNVFFVTLTVDTRTISGKNGITAIICCIVWKKEREAVNLLILFQWVSFLQHFCLLSALKPKMKAAELSLLTRKSLHWRWRHAKPLFCRQLLSFQRPSSYISTQFSSATSPGWKAALGSPWAQLRKPRDVLSVQPQPTRKPNHICMCNFISNNQSSGPNCTVKQHSQCSFVHFYTHSFCPWWGRSRCGDVWCSWGSWWTPPPLCCGWTPALPWPTGSNVGSPAKRSPADRCTHGNSSVRRESRRADTSRPRGRESMAVSLRDEYKWHWIFSFVLLSLKQ